VNFAKVHATHVKAYTLVNSLAATVSKGEVARLKADPAIEEVTPDVTIQGPEPAGGGSRSRHRYRPLKPVRAEP
jgi:hypothetical protein